MLPHDVGPHLQQRHFAREAQAKERRKRSSGADLGGGTGETVGALTIEVGKFAQSSGLKRCVWNEHCHVHTHATVHGAQRESVKRAPQTHGEHNSCNSNAGEHEDQGEVKEGERAGGGRLRLTSGCVELETDGEGTGKAGGCAGAGLVLEHFARAWNVTANRATAAGRTQYARRGLWRAI